MNQGKSNPCQCTSPKETRNNLPASCAHSLEVIGLGIIGSLIVAVWTLVADGTLRLSDYLVFVAFLLVSAGGLAWRLGNLANNQSSGLYDKSLSDPSFVATRSITASTRNTRS